MSKKAVVFISSAFLLLSGVLVITNPSDTDFQKWIEEEYDITCEKNGKCTYGEEPLLFDSSHSRNAGIFSTREKMFKSPEGEEVTVKAVGVLGQVFEGMGNSRGNILHQID